MPSPPITVFLTTIASQPALRQRQEYLLRILQVKKIPFTSYDLASDEEAKRLWKRKAPLDKQQLPGILVGGRFPGTFAEFEDAAEHGELDEFLQLGDSWDPSRDEDPLVPEAKPVGVPGVALPLQMTPERIKTKILATNKSPSPSDERGNVVPVNKSEGSLDVGAELPGYGLQGVHATEKELEDLIKELELEGAKGLGGGNSSKDVIQEPKVVKPDGGTDKE
jgi:hypothetical protein